MAGRSSPILPVRCPSARLQTSKFGKQRKDCFHSLPSVQPAQWRRSQERLPGAEDGPTGSAATTPGQHRHALSSGSDGGKSHDLASRHPRSQRQTAAGERKLARLPVSWPLRSTAEATAKTFSSPSGALSGEPLGPGRGAAVGARRTADTVRRPKAQSTVVKTVNLEASLRLVPQATSTPTIIARMEEQSRRSSHRSRGENVVASKPKTRSGASSQPQNESERLGDVRWIDKGPVVSPTHAVVVHSPLKIWPNTSSSGNKEATKDASTQSAVSGNPLNNGGQREGESLGWQGTGTQRRCRATTNMGKNVAYSVLKAPKKAGVGEYPDRASRDGWFRGCHWSEVPKMDARPGRGRRAKRGHHQQSALRTRRRPPPRTGTSNKRALSTTVLNQGEAQVPVPSLTAAELRLTETHQRVLKQSNRVC
ncbi:hypothetical protein MTO96_026736 [Rhipicephalus appendiculatus]